MLRNKKKVSLFTRINSYLALLKVMFSINSLVKLLSKKNRKLLLGFEYLISIVNFFRPKTH